MADAINDANPGLKSKCTMAVVEKWVKNNTVPSWWISPIVNAARSHGVEGVSAELLADISAERMISAAAPVTVDRDAAA